MPLLTKGYTLKGAGTNIKATVGTEVGILQKSSTSVLTLERNEIKVTLLYESTSKKNE